MPIFVHKISSWLSLIQSFVSVNEIDDDEHSNETGLGLPNTTFVNRIFDNESFSNGTTDDVLDSEELVPLDLEQILFICACLIHAAILYLIPSFAICKWLVLRLWPTSFKLALNSDINKTS